LPGKVASGGALKSIPLVPTPKVIDQVRAQFPNLHMVTFKYQEQVSHDALIDIALKRLQRGYQAVVANRGEERGVKGEQVAYLVTAQQPPLRMVGKRNIAAAIADYLEHQL
jgi:phosphopantothenoylcysteine decarboxylase/phosphopantothenate--cysteine ligase